LIEWAGGKKRKFEEYLVGPNKKIVVTTTVDLDDLDDPISDVSEAASSHARAMVADQRRIATIRTSRGRILCREIAPRTFLGLTPERRRMSILQIDDSVFIFAPRRLSRERLEHLITNLMNRYGLGSAEEDTGILGGYSTSGTTLS
jgi:hypothetical protein